MSIFKIEKRDTTLYYRIIRLYPIILCLYLIIAIQPISNAANIDTGTAPSEWTFMIFLNGDNNLEDNAIEDFIEMATAGSTDKVNIIVQMDRRPNYNTRYGNWNGTKRFNVTKNMLPTPDNATQDIGESNMGDPQSLIDFVNWTKTNYQAEHYALVLWDHGSGWKSADILPVKSISIDDTDRDVITMIELRQALFEITNNGTDKLDIIGFDACLMAMIEVDYQIMPYASFRVASEELEPDDGWDYAASMTYLINNPECNSAQLSTQIVNDYINSTGTKGEETLSAVNLTNLNDLVIATSELGNDLKNNLPLYRTQIEGVNDKVEHFTYSISTYIDLHHFATLINENINHQYFLTPIKNKTDAIIRFLEINDDQRGIIFCRTKAGTQNLAEQLKKEGFSVDALEGGMQQKERDKVMRAFKNKSLKILISTDVSARGIDVHNLAFIIHHQLPEQLEYYTHRSGRTARAGKSGLSLAFILPSELDKIHEIQKKIGIKFTETIF